MIPYRGSSIEISNIDLPVEIPYKLSDEALAEFKKLIKTYFDYEATTEEANADGLALLKLVALIQK